MEGASLALSASLPTDPSLSSNLYLLSLEKMLNKSRSICESLVTIANMKWRYLLKVLSSEMDLAEIRLIR